MNTTAPKKSLEQSTVLSTVVAYLLKRWWVFLIVGILAGLAGIFYATRLPNSFLSYTTFALEDKGGGLGGALSLAAEFGFSLGGSSGDIFAGDNILAIVSSRRIIETVLLSVDSVRGGYTTMADDYLKISKMENQFTNHSRMGTVRFPPGQDRKTFSYFQDSVLFVIYDQIVKKQLFAAKPDRKLNIYRVEFTSPAERFSKLFLERLINETNIFYTDLRTRRSLQTLNVLEKRVASMKGSAKSAIQQRAGISDANVNPAFAQQEARLQSTNIDITAYGAAYGELFKNLEVARFQYLKEAPLMQIIDPPLYPARNTKKGRKYHALVFAFVACVFTLFVLSIQSLRITLSQNRPI